MNNNFDNIAGEFLSGKNGAKISAKKNQIENLAASADGQKVKAMLEQNGSIEEALSRGDMAAVKSAIVGIMKTESGARLIKNLGDIMK